MNSRCERQDRRLRNQYLSNNTYGIEQQKIIGKAVSKQLGINLLETSELPQYGKYCPYDWVNDTENVFGELKYRRVKKDAYRTTIVGVPKIKYALSNPDKYFFFVFRFIDGLYCCDFKDIDLSQKPRLNVAKNGFSEWVYDIPINILRPLHSYNFSVPDREDEDETLSNTRQ